MDFFISLTPYIIDWLDLITRWIHIIVGIAWIGTSFYFEYDFNDLNINPGDKMKYYTNLLVLSLFCAFGYNAEWYTVEGKQWKTKET